MNRNCIEFIFNETIRILKRLEKIAFLLYSPERIRLQPGEIKSINVKIKLRLPNDLVGTCTLVPSWTENIKLLNSFHIVTDLVTASQNQPVDLPYAFAFEIQNQNMNRTCQLRKKQELEFFTLLNEGMEEIWHKFIKQKTVP